MEHKQTVERPRNGIPGWWTTVWCASTNFYLQILIIKQHQIFKIPYFHEFYSSFEKNFFSKYTQKSPKNYKTAQNIDMWDERRDSLRLKREREIPALKTVQKVK